MDRRALIIYGGFLASLVSFQSAEGASGSAGGKVCLIPTNSKAYGFSSYTGLWTSTNLDSPPQASGIGTWLGYIRTQSKIYAYNSTNDHWYQATCAAPNGQAGEDVEGATAVCWTPTWAYGIATTWTLWKSTAMQQGEQPFGGGSAGNFALVWSNQRALAYNGATGQWMVQTLNLPALGGIATGGFGLVWSSNSAYAFDQTPGSWVALDLGLPSGVSADGAGSVGVVWSQASAQAYSGMLDAWFPLSGMTNFEGGEAGGEVALLWGGGKAYSFSASTGTWNMIVLQGMAADIDEPETEFRQAFKVGPNPSSSGEMSFRLPGEQAWKIGIYDATGAKVRSLETTSGLENANLLWNGRDDRGNKVAAGSYWVRAESELRVEARRVVILE